MNAPDAEDADKRQVSILSPEFWPFALEWLPVSAYLVGGAVRDALLNRRREYLDLDFVIPDKAVKIARKIASHYKAGFVLLDAERQIARVVFKNATADFAQQEGDCLERDLQRRDFTMNAIAYNPHTGELFDPLQGYADLQAKIVRMVSPVNLQDDPLRLLRAYRQASQLGFVIEGETRSTIRQMAPLLGKIAVERVRVELNYLLNSSVGTPWLTAAWLDGLIGIWFNHATEISFTQVAAVDFAATELGKIWPLLERELSQLVRDTIKTSWLSLAKLVCLVNSDPILAELELQKLKLSRWEVKGVTSCLRLLPQLSRFHRYQVEPGNDGEVSDNGMSLREQYFFFQEAGRAFPIVAVLARVDHMKIEEMAALIDRYLNPNDQVAHPTPLISGKDLMLALNLPPSPKIGELLTEIQIARIEGKISNSIEAINLANQLLNS